MTSPARIAIVKDSFIAAYRVRLFELLADSGRHEYVVFHGAPAAHTSHRPATPPFGFPEVEVPTRQLPIANGALIWQPIVKPILDEGFDAAVLGAEISLLANYVLFVRLKRRGIPVLLWGQAREKDESHGVVRDAVKSAGDFVKRAFAKRADGYLVYGQAGREALIELGLQPDRIFVLGNTLDVGSEARLRDEIAALDEGALREELGLRPDSAVLLFVGRLYAEKRAEELIAAATRLRSRMSTPLEVVVIGDGSAMPRVVSAAEGVPGIHLVGEIRDSRRIAEYMRVATALAIPGKVGLAINHAFAHGLPVVTMESTLHAPEVDYLESGLNGVIAEPTPQAFDAALARLVEDPQWRANLAAGALQTSRSLGVDEMAQRFDASVSATLAR